MADDLTTENTKLPDRPAASGGLSLASTNPADPADGDASGFVASDASPTYAEASAARNERAGGAATYAEASAARNERAGGAATFAQESAARNERAGGAATFAQESAARNERAAPSRAPSQLGPDSRDRDRTGRISKDEGRALERAASGTSKSSFDAGKIQSVLSRLGRQLGGQKEVERQLDSAFGAGARPAVEQASNAATLPDAPLEDFTDVVNDEPPVYGDSYPGSPGNKILKHRTDDPASAGSGLSSHFSLLN